MHALFEVYCQHDPNCIKVPALPHLESSAVRNAMVEFLRPCASREQLSQRYDEVYSRLLKQAEAENPRQPHLRRTGATADARVRIRSHTQKRPRLKPPPPVSRMPCPETGNGQAPSDVSETAHDDEDDSDADAEQELGTISIRRGRRVPTLTQLLRPDTSCHLPLSVSRIPHRGVESRIKDPAAAGVDSDAIRPSSSSVDSRPAGLDVLLTTTLVSSEAPLAAPLPARCSLDKLDVDGFSGASKQATAPALVSERRLITAPLAASPRASTGDETAPLAAAPAPSAPTSGLGMVDGDVSGLAPIAHARRVAWERQGRLQAEW
ncbi:hypothetical protein V8E36_008379 [Tilletia maclaganii]